MKFLADLLKNEKGLCGLAFLLALFAIFEGAVVHGFEVLHKAGVIGSAEAHSGEKK